MTKKKTVSQELEEIVAEMCDHYCKWPEWYLMNYEDSEEAHDTMISEQCPECPLNRL